MLVSTCPDVSQNMPSKASLRLQGVGRPLKPAGKGDTPLTQRIHFEGPAQHWKTIYLGFYTATLVVSSIKQDKTGNNRMCIRKVKYITVKYMCLICSPKY